MSASAKRKRRWDPVDILMAELVRTHRNHDWQVVRALESVPPEVGHYAVYDGIAVRGAGVSWNMRDSAKKMLESQRPGLPIFMYLPDVDGSAAKYLNGAR